MSENSKREQILVNVVDTIATIPSINSVQRRKLTLDALQTIANTQLPYVAVVGQMPIPVPKFSGRTTGIIDEFMSSLEIELVVYGIDNVAPDSSISNLMDDIWAKLYEDPTRNRLALSTVLAPSMEADIFDPYFAFGVTCKVQYVHNRSGI